MIGILIFTYQPAKHIGNHRRRKKAKQIGIGVHNRKLNFHGKFWMKRVTQRLEEDGRLCSTDLQTK
jgi:hypothetical protein